MEFRVIAALLALLSSLYSSAYHSMVACCVQFNRRRRRLVHLALLLSRSVSARRRRRRRRFWKRPGRTQGWWQNFVNGTVLPEEWKKNFRMQKNNFERLCAELKPFLQREETNMRMPTSVECQVAATLYYLSDEGRMRKTANAFGISRSSVSLHSQTYNILT